MSDLSGWITAAIAITALLVNMVGGAIRFEVRMTRLERDLHWMGRELDALHERLDQANIKQTPRRDH